MKKFLSIAAVGLTLPVIGGCTVPEVESQVSRIDRASQVVLLNAPDGVQLQSGDGVASRDGDDLILKVPDGWTTIWVSHAGRTLMEEKIFVQDGSRRVFDFEDIK